MATTEEIAAGLTAEEIHQFNSMLGLMNYLCPILNNLRLDGTTYARMIMKRNDVMGKWRTPDTLEVHYCVKISLKEIQFRPTENCTLYIPVTINLPELGLIEGFIDPMTRIVSRTSPQADCRIHFMHYLNNPWGVYEYDATKNNTRMGRRDEILHPVVEEGKEFLNFEAFHDLVLTDDAEVFQEIYNSENVAEFERIHQWRDESHVISSQAAQATSAVPHSIPGIVASYLWGWLGTIHTIWLNGCAVIVTLFVLAGVIYLCAPLWMMLPFRGIERACECCCRNMRRRARRQAGHDRPTVELASEVGREAQERAPGYAIRRHEQSPTVRFSRRAHDEPSVEIEQQVREAPSRPLIQTKTPNSQTTKISAKK